MRKVYTNTRVSHLTVGELLDLLENGRRSQILADTTKASGRFVYGIAGIAGLFNCSMTTANRLKRSGKISAAITQVGRVIIVDAEKALELAGA